MLHIVLTILKIIGIIILILLALVVTLALIVLFVPVRYKGKGELYESAHFRVNISWLFHIINFSYVYSPEGGKSSFRIFGIKFKRSRKSNKRNKSDKNHKVKKNDNTLDKSKIEQTPALSKSSEIPESQKISEIPESQKISEMKTSTISEGIKEEYENIYQDNANAENKKRNSIKTTILKIISFFKNIKFKIMSICGKIKSVFSKIENLREFIARDDVKTAWKNGKALVIKLLQHVKPTKLKLKLKFGTGEPYETGKILSFICIFYGYYYKNIYITPDFDNQVLEGTFAAKGRIRGITLLIIGYKLYKQRVLLDITKL